MKKALRVIMILLGVVFLVGIVFIGFVWYKIRQMEETAGRNVEWSSAHGQVYCDLRYGDGSRNVYDLFLPAEAGNDALMLFIHGGSWMGGKKEDIEWAARRYAREGYVAATINYSRLVNDTTFIDGQPKAPSIASMVREIYLAVESIKRESKNLGHPLTQMAVGGYSAGGHLAMLYASRHARTSPLPIRFQISWVGPADFTLLFPTDAEAMKKHWNKEDEQSRTKREEYNRFVYALSGGMPATTAYSSAMEDSIKRAMSPLYNIGIDMPPAVLAYGAKDRLVLARHGELMSEALRHIGVENKLYVFPNSGHELGHDAEYADSVHCTILDYCKRYFRVR